MTSEPPAGENWSFLTDAGAFAEMIGPVYVREMQPAGDGADGEGLRFGFRVQDKHRNPGGNCHGGMLATFLDLALARAAIHVRGQGGRTPTITLQMDFLRPAMVGDWIESRCRHLRSTPRTGFCDAMLLGPQGVVLRGSGIFRIGRS